MAFLVAVAGVPSAEASDEADPDNPPRDEGESQPVTICFPPINIGPPGFRICRSL